MEKFAVKGGRNMKSTGVVRKIDELGRLVIPKELRRTLDLKDDIDYLEIYTEGSMIILKKYGIIVLMMKKVLLITTLTINTIIIIQ